MSNTPVTGKGGFAIAFLLGLMLLLGSASSRGEPDNQAFGVMLHYLPGKGYATPWSKPDIDGLVQSLADMHAGYLILTLGQNNGQFNSPNSALVEICPGARANEPRQDLPLGIGKALAVKRIKLILYLPFRAPQDDAYLMACLGDKNEQRPTSSQFIANWSAVIAYWAQHYGQLVQGWWFDGVYNTSGMSRRDWSTFCAAANKGANGRLLAFNAGEGRDRFSLSSAPCQNLMAGEFLTVPANLAPVSSPLKFHIATPLTASWGRPGPARFTSADLRKQITAARSAEGMFTLDMPLSPSRNFYAEHVALVKNSGRSDFPDANGAAK